MRMTLSVLVAVVACLQARWQTSAEACVCPGPAEELHPADGAVDVPTNTNVVVSVDSLFDASPTLRVLDGNGDPVPGAMESWRLRDSPSSGWLIFAATDSLMPNSPYVVEVDGIERSTFVTGDAEDAGSLEFGGVLAVRAVLRTEGYNDCWQFGDAVDELVVELGTIGPGVSHLVVEVRELAEAQPSFAALVPRGDFVEPELVVLSTSQCGSLGPTLSEGIEYCVRVTAYDTSGHSTEAPEVCSAPATCTGESRAGRCARSGSCSAGSSRGWMSSCLVVLLLVGALRRRR